LLEKCRLLSTYDLARCPHLKHFSHFSSRKHSGYANRISLNLKYIWMGFTSFCDRLSLAIVLTMVIPKRQDSIKPGELLKKLW